MSAENPFAPEYLAQYSPATESLPNKNPFTCELCSRPLHLNLAKKMRCARISLQSIALIPNLCICSAQHQTLAQRHEVTHSSRGLLEGMHALFSSCHLLLLRKPQRPLPLRPSLQVVQRCGRHCSRRRPLENLWEWKARFDLEMVHHAGAVWGDLVEVVLANELFDAPLRHMPIHLVRSVVLVRHGVGGGHPKNAHHEDDHRPQPVLRALTHRDSLGRGPLRVILEV
mmetsp:Transcript_25569/g.51997  ORF Transcript_25569/g.51997 Transcript_25569/m.51997 type:complete len:227 (+) Transcript_25569:390-1070(+)|eukprot:CAMPEP_0181328654 /NCGR_PEP_ID=MMETSP1101-20121128/22853_1 /TAXON_ID=46948 /ORGANISM="Rhodomonas abbreviata, Strain Caron Lab Isolate" /LENGTH=226 /DNA_ID=CAMNT_0023437601 /DNA_START=380 /DNA_END=1060 /DNA_ORIENTATION=-